MSEFKGTKGKWTIKETKKGHQQLSSDDWGNFCKVLNITNVNNKYLEVAKANALLISKAPEMLEMLQRIMKTYDKGTQTYLDCQELMKQATDI